MEREELIRKLRGFGRKRHGPRSMERTLMWAAADMLEKDAGDPEVTVELVENALGGTLLPWQRKRLEDE